MRKREKKNTEGTQVHRTNNGGSEVKEKAFNARHFVGVRVRGRPDV